MAAGGKHFFVVSKLTGFVLGANLSEDDAPVVTYVKSEFEDDTQIWYADKSTGTIRLRANGQCLHIGDDNTLRLHSLEPGNSGQLWSFKDGKIQNTVDPDKVLDISGAREEPGATVCSWSFHGGLNQLWDQIFVKPKYFYLKSELNGKVLDVEGMCPDPGTKLCMWDQKPVDSAINQLWYKDQEGIIRSRLNDFVIDSNNSQELVMQPSMVDRVAFQSWTIHGSYVALRPKMEKVIDISANNTENGAGLCAWDEHGGANQKWIIEYA